MLFIMFIACNTFALLHLLPWIWPKNMHADFSFKRNTFFQISEIYTSEISHNEYISNDCLVIQLQSAVTNVSQWSMICCFTCCLFFHISNFFIQFVSVNQAFVYLLRLNGPFTCLWGHFVKIWRLYRSSKTHWL